MDNNETILAVVAIAAFVVVSLFLGYTFLNQSNHNVVVVEHPPVVIQPVYRDAPVYHPASYPVYEQHRNYDGNDRDGRPY